MSDELAAPITELPQTRSLAGFRLAKLEVLNWGTFDTRVWSLDLRGENTLLTGDIGSGKSTLVDAVTTLLVPTNRLAYNKAAGADARERSLRSYVLGHYKSERSDSGAARPVALRDRDSHSVILGRFENPGLGETVTLAQVFWTKDLEGQPARMFVVANKPLSITEHFANFGSDIGDLRKRLRRSGFEVGDTFPPYAVAFRRLLGIDNEQALDLFHQTVSMKSVGNLTDFVRQHMLQPAATETRVAALISHFDDLSRAHAAVAKARAQIEQLEPLVADCDQHARLGGEIDAMKVSRDALRPWFALAKRALLDARIEKLGLEIARLEDKTRALDESRGSQHRERDEIKQAIADNGGDRIERLKAEILRIGNEKEARQARASKYDERAIAAGLSPASDAEAFRRNQAALQRALAQVDEEQASLQNARTEVEVEFRDLRVQHEAVQRELQSLLQRRSNIPARMLELRAQLCEAEGIPEEALPFAGELLQVRDGEQDWEGAIERLLHNFGLSLLVAEAEYAAVAAWVDRTHLRGRLVYYRVRPQHAPLHVSLGPDSLVRKLAIKPDSAVYAWLESEVTRRFDFTCTTLDGLRREKRAITRTGQVKDSGERHEKDDRHALDDRSRYVLGWSNEAKVATFERQRRDLESRIQSQAQRLADLNAVLASLTTRRDRLQQVAVYEAFGELDWRPLVTQIDDFERERKRLESESDVLRALQARLLEVDELLVTIQGDLRTAQGALATSQDRRASAERLRDDCNDVVARTAETIRGAFLVLDELVPEALGEHVLTIEGCDSREREVREWLQAKIDAEDKGLKRLTEKITQAMAAFRHAYPMDTREADASVASASEYTLMLVRLRTDDLPRFEKRFKELLNENTIREVAAFQSQLMMEQQSIRDRVDTINRSLRDIDYNPGRYMVLEPDQTPDAEVRDFRQDLRACTEGALTGSEDDAYSEAKFLQVQRIIERFRGRDGTTELDRRWTAKVTDVRVWFTFSASERWREDGSEHEHYSDSGGKSGGQKEKLAYTVLAASLAYQFGLEWGATRSRSFRFVVIDEAFGRGSDESTRYGLELFNRLALQLLIVTPLQKIHVIEPHVASVGFVHNEGGQRSMLRNLTIDQYRAEQAAARTA